MVRNRSSQDIMIAAQGIGLLGSSFSHRVGIVASSTLAFGLMRMGGAHAETAGLSVHVCRSYEAAITWVLHGDGIEDTGTSSIMGRTL